MSGDVLTFEDGCDCGHVRYRMGQPIFVNCCHCGMCQRFSGSAFAINAMIEADRVEVIGEHPPETVTTEVGGKAERCPKCGVELWAYHRKFGDAFRFIRVGTLDEAASLAPDAHFFVSRKHPWVTIPDDVPAFAELPDEEIWPGEARARFDRALARQQPTG
jgi:hypothetical protein